MLSVAAAVSGEAANIPNPHHEINTLRLTTPEAADLALTGDPVSGLNPLLRGVERVGEFGAAQEPVGGAVGGLR